MALLPLLLAGLLSLTAIELDGTPVASPPGIRVHDPSKAYEGFNLFVDRSRKPIDGEVVLTDMDGNIVRTWISPVEGRPVAAFAEPLPSGNVLVTFRGGKQTETVLVELDWSGSVVWRWDPPPRIWLHHDLERLPDGSTLVLLSRYEIDLRIGPSSFVNPIVAVIDPAGEVVWKWSTRAHWEELPLDDAEREALRRHNQSGPVVFQTNSIDSLPPNSHAASDPRFLPGNFLMSQRDTDLVSIIDRHSGRIVWSMQRTIGQHQVSMIPPGLPGAGNLLLLDNGGESLYRSASRHWSRVLEIDPVTEQTVWEYDGSDQEPFFSPYKGGAQRLPNGNTLVVDAFRCRAFEVTGKGEIVWEQVLAPPTPYRMTRVGPDWPAVARENASVPAIRTPASGAEGSDRNRRP